MPRPLEMVEEAVRRGLFLSAVAAAIVAPKVAPMVAKAAPRGIYDGIARVGSASWTGNGLRHPLLTQAALERAWRHWDEATAQPPRIVSPHFYAMAKRRGWL